MGTVIHNLLCISALAVLEKRVCAQYIHQHLVVREFKNAYIC